MSINAKSIARAAGFSVPRSRLWQCCHAKHSTGAGARLSGRQRLLLAARWTRVRASAGFSRSQTVRQTFGHGEDAAIRASSFAEVAIGPGCRD
jgi:hypothetical protein